MVRFLRERGLELPLTSHILIAVSGGADSLALLRLIARYGRRIISRSQLTALHVNHGWRGEASAGDAEFVAEVCRELEVPLIVRTLETSYLHGKGESWEDRARELRKKVFEEEARRLGPDVRVWTAHQADDLAETVLWRLFTGSARTHAGGILFETGVETRPLLFVRRAELEAFLQEEGQAWLKDPTNEDPRFLRARMRQELLPAIEAIFPRAVEHLTQLGLDLQKQDRSGLESARNPEETSPPVEAPLSKVLGLAGLKARRNHWAEIEKAAQSERSGVSIRLPQGWSLKRIIKREQNGAEDLTERRTVTRLKVSPPGSLREQWILERTVDPTVEVSREKDNRTK